MRYTNESNMDNFKKVNCSSWETLKNNVYLRLVNIKTTDKFGQDIAYQKYLDLAITFSVQEKSSQSMLTHMLTNTELENLGVSIEDVYKEALNNTKNDRKRRVITFKESTLKNNVMYPVLTIPNEMSFATGGTSVSDCGFIEDVNPKDNTKNILMLCNKYDIFGAAYMIVPDILEEIYEKFDYENFYIIPLSVHMVMCVKSSYVTQNGDKSVYEAEDDLLDMIEAFNDQNNKTWQDILSYKIYYYIGDDGKKLFLIK